MDSESSISLSDVPAALQAEICSHLRGDPYQTVRDMTAFRYTSRAQSESLLQEGYPWSLVQELKPLVRAVGQCFREEEARLSSLRHLLEVEGRLADEALLEILHEHEPALHWASRIISPMHRKQIVGVAKEKLWERLAKHATAFGPALGFLTPRQRDTLVTLVDDLPGEKRQSMAIKSLGRELADLEAPQRENLVNAALRLTNCEFQEDAITGLVASLEYLDSSQRDKLVATVINLPIVYHRARAIRALGPKLALLDEAQCAKLTQVAADLKMPDYAKAIEGLLKGLADLDPARRNLIINSAVKALDRADGIWPAGVALLPGVEYFSEIQREKVLASARASLRLCVDSYLGLMIAQAAPAMKYIDKPFRDAIFNRAINAQQGRAHALRGLGMCIAHLDEAQREALLRATSSMPLEETRSWAIAGIAAGVVHLGEDGRSTLIAEVKHLKAAHLRDFAIRSFGEGESLQHLSPAHRQDLIAAATSVGSIIGLAKGLRYLAQPERGLLLEAARLLRDPRDRAAATAALAKATSEALLFREPNMRDQ